MSKTLAEMARAASLGELAIMEINAQMILDDQRRQIASRPGDKVVGMMLSAAKTAMGIIKAESERRRQPRLDHQAHESS